MSQRPEDSDTKDPVNAFCAHGPRMVRGKPGGPLAGLRFAAKDLFDVEGYVTGCGNPDWLRTHAPATATAPSIRSLLDAGATLVAKTHTDELAYSLNGENAHYGTPINLRAPGRIPGGSSSGSAAAVAAGLVDFALGTDTGGSVRVPASYCGTYGIRPSHGRVSFAGCAPLAPSLDTVGWFADSGSILAAAGDVLLDASGPGPAVGELLIASHLFEESSAEVRETCQARLDTLRTLAGTARSVEISDELGEWANALRLILGSEAWRCHGEWITAHRPEFGPGVRERFAWASQISENDVAVARSVRQRAIDRLDRLLGDDRIIVLPTTPYCALPVNLAKQPLETKRSHILTFTCAAGLCGLPQLSLPIRRQDAPPVGLSLLGARGSDRQLLALAAAFERSFSPEARP